MASRLTLDSGSDSDFEAQRSREILHLSMERLVLENQQMRDLVGQLQSDIQTMAGSIRIPNDSDTATIRAGTIISEMDSLMPSEDRYNTPLSYGGRVQRSSTGSMSERQLGNLSPPGMLARPYHLLTTALVSTQENCTDSGTNDFSHTIDGGADSVSNPLDILGSPIGIAISTEHGNAEEATLTRIESNTHVSRKRPILYPTESMDQESFRESGFINRQTTNHKRPKTIERAWPLSPTSPNTFYEDSTSEIIQTTESSSSLTEQTTSLYAVNRPFEDILDSSWVYMRVWNRRTDESLTSSRLQSRARSLFSGISLSQVSSVSLFCLPISMSDIPISCHKWYTPSKELRPIVMEEVGRNYNIVVIGPAISGKSTLINKVIELVNYSAGMSHMLTISQQFCSINDNTSTPTLEDRHFLSVIVDDIKSSVELVDTSGYFDTYRVLIENAIREADAVVITCPADSATCIPDIKVFYSLLKRDMPVSIVMTKTDTVTQDRLRYLTHEIRRETAVLPQCTNYQYSIMSDKKSDNHFRDLIRTIRPKIPVKSTSLLGWD